MAKERFVIELGSSNTVIYKVGYGIVLREPTAVAIKSDTYEILEVGQKAKKMQGKNDYSFDIIEPIKHGVIDNKQVAMEMLKIFLSKVKSKGLFSSTEVTFCVSTGLTDNQLLDYKDIALYAGVDKLKFVNVCLSGLVGSGVKVDKPSAVACINLGGGNCNFAVVSMNKIIEGFSVSFGGKDIDKAIIDYIVSLKNMEVSLALAERIKNECGSLYSQDTSNMEITGIDCDTKRPVSEIITASEVREAIIPYFENIKKCFEKLLYSCTADVISDITQNGVYVIGGLANITGLENYLSKSLNLQIIIPDEPENCTVMGIIKN